MTGLRNGSLSLASSSDQIREDVGAICFALIIAGVCFLKPRRPTNGRWTWRWINGLVGILCVGALSYIVQMGMGQKAVWPVGLTVLFFVIFLNGLEMLMDRRKPGDEDDR